MAITVGKDTMYGGSLRDPSNSPNTAFVSANPGATFSMTQNGTGMIPGGAVQLFIRQWTPQGQTVFFQAWDGSNIWQWNLNNDNQWGYLTTSNTFPTPAFQVGGPANMWSILPQTGVAGTPNASTDQNFDSSIVIGPTTGNQTTVTFQNVADGNGGTTNIIITIEIDQPTR